MNKTKYIPFKISCPPECVCKSQERRNQIHSSCQTQQYLNENGDVVCQNYLNGKGCQPIFIKNLTFQCEEAKKKNYKYQFTNASNFIISVGLSLSSIQFSLHDEEIIKFANNLTMSATLRWYSSCCTNNCLKHQSVPLIFKCPQDCECKSQDRTKWHHEPCGTPNLMNNQGYIFCEKHKNGQGCQPYFIRHARFQCSQAKKSCSWYQYKSLGDFFMALSSCTQAAEYNLKDQDLNEFMRNLTVQIGQNWNT